jgi:hypothetical protein
MADVPPVEYGYPQSVSISWLSWTTSKNPSRREALSIKGCPLLKMRRCPYHSIASERATSGDLRIQKRDAARAALRRLLRHEGVTARFLQVGRPSKITLLGARKFLPPADSSVSWTRQTIGLAVTVPGWSRDAVRGPKSLCEAILMTQYTLSGYRRIAIDKAASNADRTMRLQPAPVCFLRPNAD